jgi:hypothetical protein
MSPPPKDRLDAWYDGSAICVIAVGSQGDPLDLGEQEAEAFIEKLRQCVRESRGGAPTGESRR